MSAAQTSTAHLTLRSPTEAAEARYQSSSKEHMTRGVWIEPAQDSLIKGELARWCDLSGEKRIKVPGYWYGKDRWSKEQARSGETVFLALHGGGYAMGSAHSTDFTSSVIQGFLDACLAHTTALRRQTELGSEKVDLTLPTRGLSVEYRLSSAASLSGILCDALAGYVHLVNRCGFDPSRIVLVGDSAGAHLALMLSRYLQDTGVYGMPRAMVLCSPWCDLSLSWYFDGHWARINSRIDFLSDGLVTARDQVLRGMPQSTVLGLYVSPVTKTKVNAGSGDHNVFKGFPPAFVVLGGRERFRDEIEEFARVYDASTAQVRLYEEGEGAHDFLALRKLGFFKEEYNRTTAAAAQWLEETLTAKA
ncbi:hypothetical protein OIV83_005524 [Microbotryomycetes sp. JL201]|nr:hypothetical protein OIV83_005524 [Microbotryomycetes sp. JL201]